jgi:phospholipase C
VPLAAVLLLNVGGFHVKGSLVRLVSSALMVPWLLASLALGGVRAGAQEGQIPIQHIVVLMQENRSFDSYFSALAGGIPSGTNPNPLGGPPISQFHKKTYCEVADLDHSWNGTHRQWNNGAMDGFTATNAVGPDPTGSRTMGYYDQTDLPFYYGLYSTFGTSDHYFASALTQTFPNRFYLLAGTSFGHIRNDFPGPTGYTQPTVFNLLDAAHVSWKIYYSQIPFADVFAYVRNHAPGNVVPISQYYSDAAAGRLPAVSFVDPIFVATNTVENDEHPPSNVQVGQNFTAGIINSLFKSPNWSSSVLFLTYDEHGGFYDGVAPPKAVAPDSIPPMYQPGDVQGGFDQLGIRVPIAVVSPYSKPHYVSHDVYDHTSILRFIEMRFGLPNLTQRDLAANPMLDFFDFSEPSFARPPVLPLALIDPAQLAACVTMPSNTGV